MRSELLTAAQFSPVGQLYALERQCTPSPQDVVQVVNSDQLEYINGDRSPESPSRAAEVIAATVGADDNGVGPVGVVQLV